MLRFNVTAHSPFGLSAVVRSGTSRQRVSGSVTPGASADLTFDLISGTINRQDTGVGRVSCRLSIRRRHRDERGAAAVEFALVSLLFFTLLFGTIQFGMWFWAWQQGAHAAREASRFAAVYPACSSGIQDKGVEALEGAPVSSSSVSVGAAPTQVGEPITVTVTAQTIDIGFFDFFTPGITKVATSRVENIPSGSDCPP